MLYHQGYGPGPGPRNNTTEPANATFAGGPCSSRAEPMVNGTWRFASAWNDSEHEAYSAQRCNGHGLYVLNSPQPWCECDWGWEGSRCERPHDRAPRGALLYLSYGDRVFFQELVDRLPALEERWYEAHPDLEVVIFVSPGLLRPGDPLLLRDATRWKSHVHEVWVDLPDNDWVREKVGQDAGHLLRGATHDYDQLRSYGSECMSQHKWTWRLGYFTMNRFFCMTFFTLPQLAAYDYLLKLDTHMVPRFPYPCNLFRTMASSKAVFGHLHSNAKEDASCLGGLRETLEAYSLRYDFTPNHLEWVRPPNHTVISGAFMMFKMSFWRHPQVQSLLQFWDGTGWLYRSRAADQALLRWALAVFVPWSTRVHQFCHFPVGAFWHYKTPIYPDNMCGEPDPYCTL